MTEQKRNYQRELEEILASPDTLGKRLFLHACCAPCSSYVLEYLSQYFEITVFYYNPNITVENEFMHRMSEERRLIEAYMAEGKCKYPIHFVPGTYEPGLFLDAVKGLEDAPEGGDRCAVCFGLRLHAAAKLAADAGFDYYTTTLTVGPRKNAETINRIGRAQGKQFQVEFLPSDFKKKNGFKRSVELSHQYDLYRQNYCGCHFSRPAEEEDAKAGSAEDAKPGDG
ncbi:MAG: epoxyqueuosine reductase QueH [Lachnospiraceae bacterium]|nr:epoxyqueuosine reductase QueH [Lachnospiraceae bacterium]